jgi:hypothetical protein
MLLDLLDGTERATRGVASLRTGHAVGDKLVFEQLEVRADLASEVGLGASWKKRGQQAEERATHQRVPGKRRSVLEQEPVGRD